jgi:hypothetical protein
VCFPVHCQLHSVLWIFFACQGHDSSSDACFSVNDNNAPDY